MASKFLLQQHKELHEHPLYGIIAEPREDNIKEWCGNVFFPEDSAYPGLVLHFVLNFDDQYPNTSPNLKLKTTIDHTHVFGERCCFSLLPDFRGYFEGIGLSKTAYWNPARTVRSFLEGFYQFLVIDCDRESHGRSPVTASQREQYTLQAKNYVCGICQHSFVKPNPAKPNVTQDQSDNYNDEKYGKGEVMTEDKQAADDLKCSITGKGINEAIIGFGVHVEDGRNGKQITTDLYPLSYDAFYTDKVRISAGGQALTHWLPFAINQENWDKVFPVAKEAFSLVMKNSKDQFQPSMVFDVIGELWKTKAVEMMKGAEHASEKVLFGFCAFHHLLLAFTRSIPDLVNKATDKVEHFLASPDNRNKTNVPDFGRFLPLFLISKILWEDSRHAGRTCVSELFTRNAMWILKVHGDLANPEADNNRIVKSWEPSQVGLKLTCFQVRYILEVGRPANETDITLNWERLNKLYGRPTQAMVSNFQQTVKKVQAIGDYLNWFQAMGLGAPPKNAVLQMLQDGVRNSETQGYHGGKGGRGGGGGGRGGGRGGRGRGN